MRRTLGLVGILILFLGVLMLCLGMVRFVLECLVASSGGSTTIYGLLMMFVSLFPMWIGGFISATVWR